VRGFRESDEWESTACAPATGERLRGPARDGSRVASTTMDESPRASTDRAPVVAEPFEARSGAKRAVRENRVSPRDGQNASRRARERVAATAASDEIIDASTIIALVIATRGVCRSRTAPGRRSRRRARRSARAESRKP